jgi:hypothetical protein
MEKLLKYAFIILPLLMIGGSIHCQQNGPVFPYKYQEKSGLIDRAGNIILSPLYEDIEVFANPRFNNYTLFRNNDKYGLIDKTGTVVLPAIHERITYNGNGGFVWYYEDNYRDEGVHMYSTKSGEQIFYSDSMRVREVLGQDSYFVEVQSPDMSVKYILNEAGKRLFDIPRYRIFRIDYPEEECPLLSYGDRYRSTFFDCYGNPTTFDEYLEKYDVEEQDIDFMDMDVEMDDSPTILSKTEVQNRLPAYKVHELVVRHDQLISIVVSKDYRYGLVDISGAVLLELKYAQASVNQGYISVRENAKMGLFSITGEEILPVAFQSIYPKFQRSSYFFVTTHSGYSGYADFRGHVYLPTEAFNN